MEIKRLISIKLLLLLGLIFIISPCFAQEIPQPSRARIGFGSTINDAEIIKLLKRYPVSVNAVLLWSYGLGGSYRTFENVGTEEMVKNARTHFIASIKKSWSYAMQRIVDFTGSYTKEDVNNDEGLQTQARSLLNFVQQCEKAIVALESSKPVFYGIEFEEDDFIFEEIINEPMVQAYISSGNLKNSNTFKGKGIAILPEAYSDGFTDPSVLHASPRSLYKSLLNELKKHEGGAND